ncbi:MAG: NusG domain II-containing protein [Blautia sp.]|nr:NusG domain II-containing protein [Blautia sp.]
MKKKDGILILTLLLVAVLSWATIQGIHLWQGRQIPKSGETGEDYSQAKEKDKTGRIRITVGNHVLGEYSLGMDQTIQIGETNVCEIKDGKAVMTQAECPDHVCMMMSPIDSPYDMIVCLPNQVVIEGLPENQNDEETALDGVS